MTSPLSRLENAVEFAIFNADELKLNSISRWLPIDRQFEHYRLLSQKSIEWFPIDGL